MHHQQYVSQLSNTPGPSWTQQSRACRGSNRSGRGGPDLQGWVGPAESFGQLGTGHRVHVARSQVESPT